MALGEDEKFYCRGAFSKPIFNAKNVEAIPSEKKYRKKNYYKKMDLLDNEYLLFFNCAQKNKLRYMIIGGYAVNYYGYNRNTDDLDIWIAPTNENKLLFIQTLLCMNYSEKEVAPLYKEDFTQPFITGVGGSTSAIDFLTVVHFSLSFDEAEKIKVVHEIMPDLFIHLTLYEFLIDMKLKSRRDKDLWDIALCMKLKQKLKRNKDGIFNDKYGA